MGGIEGGDLLERAEIDGLGDDGIDGIALWGGEVGEVRGHGGGRAGEKDSSSGAFLFPVTFCQTAMLSLSGGINNGESNK